MEHADQDTLPFWFREGRGATEDELVAAEKYVGHSLPIELRTLLMQVNGGVSNYEAYDRGVNYYPLLPICGVDPDAASGTLMTAHDVRDAFEVPDGVVVFAAQGHAWWGLDYRKAADRPAVVYCNEVGDDVEEVATDFTEFLGGLKEEGEW